MPDATLSQRFEAVVQSAQEPLVHRYLEDALRCFDTGVYNGAVVFAWSAVACYLRLVVEEVGIDLFKYSYRDLYKINPTSDLWRINDKLFIQTCEKMGLRGGVVGRLDEFRLCRNECAHPHPTGIFKSADETLELVDGLSEVVSNRVADERLTGIDIVRDFIKNASEQDGAALAPWIQDDLCPQLAQKLLTAYLNPHDTENLSGIKALWHPLWNRLDDTQRQHLWNRLENAVKNVLSDDLDDVPMDERSYVCTPEELAYFIVWPSPDEDHNMRDRIGEMYVTWFDGLVQNDMFCGADLDLGRWLRQYLPTPLEEQLQATLKDMTRRFVE